MLVPGVSTRGGPGGGGGGGPGGGGGGPGAQWGISFDLGHFGGAMATPLKVQFFDQIHNLRYH